MQYSFSLNNFGVLPSTSNSGDGVSEVVLSLIKGEKTKPNQNNTKQKKHHKVSQVQMQYTFSKFFSMQV
jgi:hypothetical protein